jgi:cbb3-type cytochrome c oxidase subunit III
MRVAHTLALEAACVAALTLMSACQTKERAAATDTAHPIGTAGGTVALRTFNGDPQAAKLGRQDFLTYNCYGCHGGLAGGAMGPSLRDDAWKYGGTDSAIYASIRDGRPAGMPKWAGMIKDSTIRQLVVYIRSLRTSAEPTFFFSMTDTTTHAGTGTP